VILEAAFRHIGGDNQFGVVGVPAVLQAVSEGSDLKLLMTVDTPRVTAQLVARPEIRSAQDLQGKRFGVASIGTGAWINSNLAQGEGLLPRSRMASAGIQGVQSGLAVDAAYLREHPEVAQRMVDAMVEGLAFSLPPANEQVVRRVLASRMNLENAPAAVEAGYRSFVARANRKFQATIPAIETMQRVMSRADRKLLDVKVGDLVDDRFVRQLEESGAAEKLFRDYGVR
jgi:ABC-type nitrate/sulfonate/bicarbonate transport system substrate-binding protein